VKIDWECLRAQLAAPWSAGVAGKGLLLRDGGLHTWCLFDDGSPHHTDAQHLLELPTTRLAAYLTFEPDGAVTVWPVDGVANGERLIGDMIAADKRLYRAPPPTDCAWDFLEDESG
jgi:hypothetical protein